MKKGILMQYATPLPFLSFERVTFSLTQSEAVDSNSSMEKV